MTVIRGRGRWHGNQKYVPVHLTKKAQKHKRKKPTQRSSQPTLTPEYVIKTGRYKGTQVKDIPSDFLEWCSSKGITWARAELFRRESGLDKEGGVDREFREMVRNF
jgi:hypothetical protein